MNKLKKQFCAQAAIETLVVLAIGLVILTSLVAMVYNSMNSDYVIQQQKQGSSAAKLLVSQINDAYFLGAGTTREVTLRIPETTDLSKSFISGKTLVLNVSGTDLIFGADVNIVGSWPNADGSYVFVITAFDDFVSVSIQSASFSPSQISQTLSQNTTVDVNILFTNVSNHSVSYSINPAIGSGASVSYGYSQANPFSVDSGNSKSLIFTVGCDRNSSGSYAGSIILPSQSNADINLSLPVRVFCSASQTKLNIFPGQKLISATSRVNSVDSILVCNGSQYDFSNSISQITGGLSQFVFTSFNGAISANTCRTLLLDINAPLYGNYFGVISVSAGGFTATSDVNLNVS